MSDDNYTSGPQDGKRINMHEDYEVRYWTEALGVSEERLAALVKEHGNSAERVRQALAR